MPRPARRPFAALDLAIVAVACAVFFLIATYQLQLPGLYYDEAWDAVSAMQIVQGLPTELQRGAGIDLLGRHWPLMLGDYQGIVSTYLLLPFFLLGGINVTSLRLFPILAGVLTIVLTYALARAWFGTSVARVAVLLLAVSPSWIFWSRLGVYVVSEIVPFTVGALLALTLWWRGGRLGWLLLGAFLLGLDLSTKLLGVWPLGGVILCLVLLEGRRLLPQRGLGVGSWGLGSRSQGVVVREQESEALSGEQGAPLEPVPTPNPRPPTPNPRRMLFSPAPLVGIVGYALGALPFLLYNLQTRGTWLEVRYSLFQSRSGVTNTTILPNLWQELHNFQVLLDGSYFWFQAWLGVPYSNPLPPLAFVAAAGGLLALTVRRVPRTVPLGGRGLLLAQLGQLPVLALAAIAVVDPERRLGAVVLLPFLGSVGVAGALWIAGLRVPGRWLRVAGWHLLAVTGLTGVVWWATGALPADEHLAGPLDLRATDVAGLLFWLALFALLALLGWTGPFHRWQRPLVATLGFIAGVIALSFPTLSGLWVTHLLVLLPLPQILIAAGLVMLWRVMLGVLAGRRRPAPATGPPLAARRALLGQMGLAAVPTLLLLLALLVSELLLDAAYQSDLTRTGGLFAFSDAIYDMSSYVNSLPPGRRVAVVEWGIRRQIQILSEGRVNPDEIFQYADQTPPEFYTALQETLLQPDTLYLFTAGTIGPYKRFPDFETYLAQHGLEPVLEHQSIDHLGSPIYQAYTVRPRAAGAAPP